MPPPLVLPTQVPSGRLGTAPVFGSAKKSGLDMSNLTVNEREEFARARMAERVAAKRMLELEEERAVQDEVNRELDAIHKKERMIERSKSRGKSPAAPGDAPVKVVTKA